MSAREWLCQGEVCALRETTIRANVTLPCGCITTGRTLLDMSARGLIQSMGSAAWPTDHGIHMLSRTRDPWVCRYRTAADLMSEAELEALRASRPLPPPVARPDDPGRVE